jgi:hypothetical protein
MSRMTQAAFPVQLRGMFEHLLFVAGQVFGKEDVEFDVVLSQEIDEHLLPFDLRELAEIPVPPKEVEGVLDETVLSARCEFGLKLELVRPSWTTTTSPSRMA